MHNWPSASVASIQQAYSWFYQLATMLEADAQHCRRIACFGASAVWLCVDNIASLEAETISIADEMNKLLDGDYGCLDAGDKSMVQGMVSFSFGCRDSSFSSLFFSFWKKKAKAISRVLGDSINSQLCVDGISPG